MPWSAASTARRGWCRSGCCAGRRWLLCLALLCLPVFLPYGALLNAAFSKIPSQPLTFETLTLHNFHFVFFELSATKVALKNTFLLGALAATLGTLLALVIAYLTSARRRARASGPGLPCDRADRHSRHRARRRPVPQLHAAAVRALRHAVDPAARLS